MTKSCKNLRKRWADGAKIHFPLFLDNELFDTNMKEKNGKMKENKTKMQQQLEWLETAENDKD